MLCDWAACCAEPRKVTRAPTPGLVILTMGQSAGIARAELEETLADPGMSEAEKGRVAEHYRAAMAAD
jgi:hypothetical protein